MIKDKKSHPVIVQMLQADVRDDLPTGEDRLWESKFYIDFQPKNGHQTNRTI